MTTSTAGPVPPLSAAIALLGLASASLGGCGGDGGDGAGGTETRTVEEDGVRLEVPRTAPAGSPVEVVWSGPAGEGDYIAIAAPGAPGGSTVDWTRTSRGSPLTVRPPDTAGAFEVRYVTGKNDSVLVAADLEVTEVEATLDAPGQVGAGTPIEVTWTGPDNPGDYVAIAAEGAPGGSTEDWTRTSRGSPLTVRPPDTPGAFEVRYVMGQSDRVLARSPLEVTPVEASVEIADTVMVNTPVEVRWTGPDNPGDYVAFAERGAPGGSTVNWTRTNRGDTLSLRTPGHPGRYELRYVTGQSDRVLARRNVTVLPLQARLRAPDTVGAGREVTVFWFGPNGPDDFVALATPAAPVDSYESRALSRAGEPATLFAPNEAGTYELRYVWSEQDSVLARRPVVVTRP